jgi:NADH-quinone oxidoreductase subunit N
MILLPFILLGAGALVVLVAEPWLGSASRKHSLLPWLAAGLVLLSCVGYLPQLVASEPLALHGLLLSEPVRALLGLAVGFAAICALAGLQQGLARDGHAGGEPYVLVMVSALGALLMIHAVTSIAVFLGLELLSLPIYALVATRRERPESQEGLLKYFLMGAVFSAIFLYGAVLVYGATGSFVFAHPALDGRSGLFFLGHLLMIAGLLFKLGSVPFHFWTADAYSAAPLAVTGFMGAVVKLAGLAVLGSLWLGLVGLDRLPWQPGSLPQLAGVIAVEGVGPVVQRWSTLLLCVAILSILLGNFSALGQHRARRMLAFSSIAHVGYMLLAFALPSALQEEAGLDLGPLWYYAIAYAVALSGLLLALATLPARNDEDGFAQLAGLARQRPYVGVAATICLASLAGFPPTAGFLGKYLIFSGLVRGGYTWLAVCAIVLAVVGAVYYLRLLALLWSGPGLEQPVRPVRPLTALALALAAILVLALLVLPGLVTGATLSPSLVASL